MSRLPSAIGIVICLCAAGRAMVPLPSGVDATPARQATAGQTLSADALPAGAPPADTLSLRPKPSALSNTRVLPAPTATTLLSTPASAGHSRQDPPIWNPREPTGLLYCPTQPDNPAFRDAVSGLLGGLPVDYFDARVATPSLSTLLAYSTALTWANYPYADKVAMGNVLAQYVDLGGRVLLGQWTQPTATNFLAGAIMDPNNPYLPATATTYGPGTYAGDGTGCVFDSVAGLTSQYRDHCTLTWIGFAAGTWSGGYPLLACRPDRRVWANPGNTAMTFGTGDWARLTANLCVCTLDPLYGACCDAATGTCTDDVDASDCIGFPLQWSHDVLCADLVPPCANPGACCDDETGDCTDTFQLDCPGRFAAGEGCATYVFTPPCGEIVSCENTIVLWDDSGDGWNGGFINVYLDGTLIAEHVTLQSGYGPHTVPISVYHGGQIATVWTPGEWPYEASYCIYAADGVELGCDGSDGVSPDGTTVTATCGTVHCGDGVCAPNLGESCVTCPQDCGQCSCLIQHENQLNGIFSDLDCGFCSPGPIQIVADNFRMPFDSHVSILSFAGGYYPDDFPPETDLFTVVFRLNDGTGVPGPEFVTYGPLPGYRSPTGEILFGVREYRYEILVNEYLPAGDYWIEIFNDTSASPDSWFWEIGDFDPFAGLPGCAIAITLPEEWSYAPTDAMSLEIACFDDPCSHSEPGFHWIAATHAGYDTMDSAALVGIDVNLDCQPDTTLLLSGPITVSRSAPLDDSASFPGLRPVDGQLDVIDMEILSMQLADIGLTLVAGAEKGQGATLDRSLGAIAEDPADPRDAETFFNIFFELDFGDGQYAYNHEPLVMQVDGTIFCVPPDVSFVQITECLPLYTDPVGGVLVGNIVAADHDTYAEATACCFCDGPCQELLPSVCDERGGMSLPQTSCTPDPCNYMKIDPPPDVDKPDSSDENDQSCWLAVAANMLAGAGYGTGDTVQERAESIYAQLLAHFAQASGWPNTAIEWWLNSDHNTWPDNPYRAVTCYGNDQRQPWNPADAPRFIGNELRRCQMVSLHISWPTDDPNYPAGIGGHALTAWGDNGGEGPLTTNPDCVRVTNSEGDDLDGDTETYRYDDPNSPNPGGPNEGPGFYLDYSHIHPFLTGCVTLCPVDNPTGQPPSTQTLTASLRIHQTQSEPATDLHYTIGTEVDILTHTTTLSWTTSNPPTITADADPPHLLTVDWDLTDHPVPYCNSVTLTADLDVPEANGISFRDVHFTYGSDNARLNLPDLHWNMTTPLLPDPNLPNVTGGFVVGAFELYSDPWGVDLLAQYRFQHQYRYDQNPELHDFALESAATDTCYVRGLHFGRTHGLLDDNALWTFADWLTEDTAPIPLPPGTVYTLPLDWTGLVPYAPACDFRDCNGNDHPDELDIVTGYSLDLNGNGIPDECDPQLCAGDLNCDGLVNYSDIDPFVAALTCIGGDPGCWPPAGIPPDCPWLNGDCNDDSNVTYADIDPFVARIGATCP